MVGIVSRLPRAMHDLDSVPYIDAGILACSKQLVCESLGFGVGVAMKYVSCLDAISCIYIVEAIDCHSRSLGKLARHVDSSHRLSASACAAALSHYNDSQITHTSSSQAASAILMARESPDIVAC